MSPPVTNGHVFCTTKLAPYKLTVPYSVNKTFVADCNWKC